MLNAKKIENYITKRKMTKAKLCSNLGIARSTLDSILNGADAKISTIEAIANELEITMGFLFDEEIIQIREAGRDCVEKGKIEHRGTEHSGGCMVANEELVAENAELKCKLILAQERIIELMEDKQ